ncbi:hypothetical protein GJQ55_00550 [Venatoribacter cucullus]|uniref:Uncharacterized protein n=1 Tax=Venatoribacter cucullus TaxID=2661630 RepID=A0A9X7YNG1_9GAMM|nr:hypothetical protein [Venatoribacter cucullus]QQD23052.1 hypothetical protein GJQ55_00550 [Venatoribacter cucullus]
MSEALNIPSGLVFLPLGEEALPLLKRGVVPLLCPADSGLPWFVRAAEKAQAPARIDDAAYLAHLQREYQRLPDSLRGLLTQEVFIQQAEKKRADIEAALLAQQQAQAVQDTGNPEDWLLQRFYTDPFSLLAWQQGGGLKTLWLGIDASQWPEAALQSVEYRPSLPAAYPQRLWAESPVLAPLQEQRLVLARADAGRLVEVAGRTQGLLRLPPVALRCVLLGAEMRPAFVASFRQFWQQDFRYQRMPLARMQLQSDRYGWDFIQTVSASR